MAALYVSSRQPLVDPQTGVVSDTWYRFFQALFTSTGANLVKPLLEAKYAENAQTTQYTAPANRRTTVSLMTATNNSGVAASLTVNIVPSGSAAAASNIVISAQSIAAGASYTCPEMKHTLAAGDFISTLASAASAIIIRISGSEDL